MKKIIMLLLLLTIIPILVGCDLNPMIGKKCNDAACIQYVHNIQEEDTIIQQGETAKYRYVISTEGRKSYQITTYEDGVEYTKTACVPVNGTEAPEGDFEIKTTGLELNTEIHAIVKVYSDANCKTKITSVDTNKLLVKSKAYAVGPYNYDDGTVSVCPESKGCITELSNLGYTAQTTSTNCHATAKGYIDGIAKAIGGDFSSSNYTKQLYKKELGDDDSANLATILAKIKSEIDAGRPVLARVYRPTRDKDSSTIQETTTHSVTVVAYKNSGTKMSDFIIVDPWYNGEGGPLVSCTLNRGTYMGNYDYRFCSMQYDGQKSSCSVNDKYSIMAYSG